MAKKREKLDQMMQVPVSRTMQQAIERLADQEERRPTEMARILWREAMEARAENELATSSK